MSRAVFLSHILSGFLFCSSLFFAAPAISAPFQSGGFSTFTTENLDTLIQTNHCTRVSEVVPLLPDFLRQNLTFVFESFSAQPAHVLMREKDGTMSSGVEGPRAVLWDVPGEYFLTFNGHSTARGFNTIEHLQFRRTQNRKFFEFSGIDFANGTPKKISGQICTMCHGTMAGIGSRPLWSEYPSWTGVYGSHEDIVRGAEKPLYDQFRKSAIASNLYGSLFPTDAWENYPLKKDANVVVTSESHTFKYRPNTRTGILLNRLNAERIFSILQLGSRYPGERLLLARTFLGCQPVIDGFALLKKYGITVRDLDIRYPYNDPQYEKMDFSDSYFDGTATTNELLAAFVLQDLTSSFSELAPFVRYRTIAGLYSTTYHKLLDSEFMAAADSLGYWIRTPFPAWQHKVKLRPLPTPVEVARFDDLCQKLETLSPIP